MLEQFGTAKTIILPQSKYIYVTQKLKTISDKLQFFTLGNYYFNRDLVNNVDINFIELFVVIWSNHTGTDKNDSAVYIK